MGNKLPTKKLDRHNYAYWEYKMHQYLIEQGTRVLFREANKQLLIL